MTHEHEHILCIDSPDKPGIVAAVAGILRDYGCNIEESAQFNDKLSGQFFMRTVIRPCEDNASIDRLRQAFVPLAEKFSMNLALHDGAAKVRTLVMVSKSDHCLNDILYRWRTGHLPIEITGVVSNHENNRETVEDRGLPFIYLPVTKDTKAEQETELANIVRRTDSELIVMARYMQILSDDFCRGHAGRVINIHHSFLPGFKGAKPYHQAYERGVKIVGATAHFATADLDEGPIIEQETVRIDHTKTPEKLQVLGKDIEARVLSRAILAFTERRIFLQGRRTIVL
jgi:formyltetrahydrofolate deformylase